MTPSELIIPFGYCQCGCGSKTTVSSRTRTKRGVKKGMPVAYISGHNATERTPIESAAPFKINGVYCRLIPLTQDQYTIVDEKDYEWLCQWKWQAKRHHNGYYACRSERCKGRVTYISMHRQLLCLSADYEHEGDHKNLNTLDNRFRNLRLATRSQQQCNRRIPKSNKTGCKGVSITPWGYRVRLYVGRRSIELGTVPTIEQAKEIYATGVAKYHGEFARFA